MPNEFFLLALSTEFLPSKPVNKIIFKLPFGVNNQTITKKITVLYKHFMSISTWKWICIEA